MTLPRIKLHRMSRTFLCFLSCSVIFTIILVVSFASIKFISTEPAKKDALQNFGYAFNLAKHGIYSIDGVYSMPADDADLKPSMKREPLPNVVLAAWLRLTAPNSLKLTVSEANRGENVRWAKFSNIIWICIIIVLVFISVNDFTKSMMLAVLASAVCAYWMVLLSGMIDRLYTEPQAAATILGSSYLLALSVRRSSVGLGLAAGVVGGCVALTKAVALYVLPFVALGMMVLLVLRGRRLLPGLLIGIAFLFGSSLVVGPWIARNTILFNESQISTNAGKVLYVRMLYDGMTSSEYRGSFYVWAPSGVKHLFEKYLGFKRSDLEEGGSLRRLTRGKMLPQDKLAIQKHKPELATTYYNQTKAELKRRIHIFAKQGHPDRTRAAQQDMKSEAVASILEMPLDHLTVSLPIAWRGIWVRGLAPWLAFVCFLSLLALPIIGIAMRRWEYVAFSLLPLGIYAIYSLGSHHITRYTLPIVPTMFVAIAVIFGLMAHAALNLVPPSTVSRLHNGLTHRGNHQ